MIDGKHALSPLHAPLAAAGAKFMKRGDWQTAASFPDEYPGLAEDGVVICDQSHRGKIRVEGKGAAGLVQAKEMAINAGREGEDGRLYRLRHDLFFLSTPADSVSQTHAALAEQTAAVDGLITITDVTHGSAELWLIGPRSADLLSRLCGLDFHNSFFPNATAKQGSVAKTSQLIIRNDLKKELPAYALVGPRSFAPYLWRTIMQAGRDLNLQPIGEQLQTALLD